MHRAVVLASLIFVSPLHAAFPVRDEAAIQSLKDGKTTEANAAWWGFDEKDATKALQAAINSGAKRVVVPNVGAPWVVTGIKLASDQEVVFEKGVEVQAKRGEFKEPNASLFIARNKKNIRLTGHEATLRMWKADYQSADYKKAEWRHALAFWSCEKVEITGLSVIESGGDGLYLGCGSDAKPCSDFVVRDVNFLNHHRQGISVICAERLLIENCTLSATSGTAPQAGIDFEPNEASERLVDCTMRNCTLEGNEGGAFLFALGKIRPSSKPLSITIENCRSAKDSQAIYVSLHPPVGVGGAITFDKCRMSDTTKSGVMLRNLHAGSAKLTFRQCEFVKLADTAASGAPIVFRSDTFGKAVGGVQFDDCMIEDTAQRRPIAFANAGSLPMRDVTGKITVKAAGETKALTLDDKQIREWFPSQIELVNLPVIECDPSKLNPAWPQMGPMIFRAGTMKQRHDASWMAFAQNGQQVLLTIATGAVGKAEKKPALTSVRSPSGKEIPLKEAPGGLAFAAEETGAYRVLCKAGSNSVQLHAPFAPACAYAPDGAFSFIYPAGDQFFLVPAGTGEFAITIGGDGAEKVRAMIFSAAGKIEWNQDNIDAPRQFHFKRTDSSADEIWCLRLMKPTQGVCEDYQVLIEGIPPLLAATPEAMLGLRAAPPMMKPRYSIPPPPSVR